MKFILVLILFVNGKPDGVVAAVFSGETECKDGRSRMFEWAKKENADLWAECFPFNRKENDA